MLSLDNMSAIAGDAFASPSEPYNKMTGSSSSSTNLGNNGLYVLVRIAPGTKQFSLPFARATSWDRLITSLYQIYTNNNSNNTKCTLQQAYSSIRVSCDESGARILAEFWSELLRPTMPIAVEFTQPFIPPPWDYQNVQTENVKKEDSEDVEMLTTDIVETTEPSSDNLMALDTDVHNKLTPEPSGIASNSAISTDAYATPELAPASIVENPWTPFNDDVANSSFRWSLTNSNQDTPQFTKSVQNVTSVAANPTPTSFINQHENHVRFGKSVPSDMGSPLFSNSVVDETCGKDKQAVLGPLSVPTQIPTSFTTSNGEAFLGISSYGNSRTPPPSPSLTSAPSFQQGPATRSSRKRKANLITPSSYSENDVNASRRPPIREPMGRALSHRNVSRKISDNKSIAVSPQPVKEVFPRHEKCTVLVQNALLLDAISAGEQIKVVKTVDGEIIAMRQEEDLATIRERSNSIVSLDKLENDVNKPDLQSHKPTSSKKRGYDNDMDALIQIWSGGGVPASKKMNRLPVFDKLAAEDKIKLQKLVREHHIIRIDHLTAPYIEAWKADVLPETDETQCNDYIVDVATTVYNTESKREDAYRLFLQNSEYISKRI